MKLVKIRLDSHVNKQEALIFIIKDYVDDSDGPKYPKFIPLLENYEHYAV